MEKKQPENKKEAPQEFLPKEQVFYYFAIDLKATLVSVNV